MVEQKIIQQLQIIIDELTKQYSDISVFALFKMDDLMDKWTIILSAPWIDSSTRSGVFYKVRELLLKHLSKEELALVARIGIFETNEHLIELIIDGYRNGDRITSDEKINGNIIHEGYILISNKILSSQSKLL